MNFLKTIIIVLVASTSVSANKADSDLVTNLPGINNNEICWKHWAGYLPTDLSNVKAADAKNLFYWYHEAVTEPSTKPLILWLNGGPGCSSLGGMMGELGPFVVGTDQMLSINPFSFNK